MSTPYRFTDLPIYRFTDLPLYRFTDLPLYLSLSKKMLVQLKRGRAGLAYDDLLDACQGGQTGLYGCDSGGLHLEEKRSNMRTEVVGYSSLCTVDHALMLC